MAVQVRIEDLRHPQGGHARITLTGTGRAVATTMLIRRFDNQDNYLSPQGWRGPETPITPASIESVANGVAVEIGPDLTEWLEFGQRIEIALPGTGIAAMALWPEIGTYTGGRRARGRLMGGAGERPVRRPPPKPMPRPVPTPAPTMVAPLPPPEPVVEPAIVAKPAGRRGLALGAAAAAVVLLLAAAGGYYLYSKPREDTVAALATPEVAFDLSTLVNRPPPEVFQMGEIFWNRGSYQLALELFRDASRRGFARAHTRIGQLYDPASFEANKPFQRANPREAIQHYDAAIAGGDNAAQSLREALLTRLRDAARGADQPAREAQTILRELRL